MYLMDKLYQYGLITWTYFFKWCNSSIQIHFHWWVKFIHMANHIVNFIHQHIYPCRWVLMWYPSSSMLSTSSKWSFWFTKLTYIHIEVHPCGELHPNKTFLSSTCCHPFDLLHMCQITIFHLVMAFTTLEYVYSYCGQI